MSLKIDVAVFLLRVSLTYSNSDFSSLVVCMCSRAVSNCFNLFLNLFSSRYAPSILLLSRSYCSHIALCLYLLKAFVRRHFLKYLSIFVTLTLRNLLSLLCSSKTRHTLETKLVPLFFYHWEIIICESLNDWFFRLLLSNCMLGSVFSITTL